MQFAGRAGRRGHSTQGIVIYLPIYEFPDVMQFKTVMLGKLNAVESKFDINYRFYSQNYIIKFF